jgi:hypothetical protein
MVSIQMPEESFTLENIQYAKKGLAKEISRYFPDVTTVQFTESHIVKAPAPKPAEEKAAAAPAEAKAEQEPAEAKPEAAASKVEKTEKKSAKAKKSQQSEQ